MARKGFCEKDGILITYTANDVCFEDCKTAEAVLFFNDGSIIHSNFDDEKDKYFQEYLKKIIPPLLLLEALIHWSQLNATIYSCRRL